MYIVLDLNIFGLEYKITIYFVFIILVRNSTVVTANL